MSHDGGPRMEGTGRRLRGMGETEAETLCGEMEGRQEDKNTAGGGTRMPASKASSLEGSQGGEV